MIESQQSPDDVLAVYVKSHTDVLRIGMDSTRDEILRELDRAIQTYAAVADGPDIGDARNAVAILFGMREARRLVARS